MEPELFHSGLLAKLSETVAHVNRPVRLLRQKNKILLAQRPLPKAAAEQVFRFPAKRNRPGFPVFCVREGCKSVFEVNEPPVHPTDFPTPSPGPQRHANHVQKVPVRFALLQQPFLFVRLKEAGPLVVLRQPAQSPARVALHPTPQLKTRLKNRTQCRDVAVHCGGGAGESGASPAPWRRGVAAEQIVRLHNCGWLDSRQLQASEMLLPAPQHGGFFGS